MGALHATEVGEGTGRRPRAAGGRHRPESGERGPMCGVGSTATQNRGGEPLTGGAIRHIAGWRWFKFNSNLKFKCNSNFDPIKKDLPALKNFEIKYGYGGFEESNNFLHRNFSRFRTDFK
jgi:hypothetical protein